jgi:hypothetical protein
MIIENPIFVVSSACDADASLSPQRESNAPETERSKSNVRESNTPVNPADAELITSAARLDVLNTQSSTPATAPQKTKHAPRAKQILFIHYFLSKAAYFSI